MKRLASFDGTEIAYDARGHGESGKPHDPDAYAPDAMPRDAQALLDHLGVDEVDIVGYSMGALVATRLVPVEPRTRSVVFGGVGASLVEGRGVTTRRELAEGLLADEPRSVTNPLARAFRRFADRMGADRFALAGIQQAPRAKRPDLTKITVPALVLVGDGDTIAKNPQELAAALPRATARIVSGDHLDAMYDALFSAHIVQFLSGVPQL
ncbi:MAG: alpha/beta fold hydrolase [Actinomycetota bacterium]|nr:alpha/beta fold hydrolase [Actinomycetota bacterium]